jgi:hypothetical protein
MDFMTALAAPKEHILLSVALNVPAPDNAFREKTTVPDA